MDTGGSPGSRLARDQSVTYISPRGRRVRRPRRPTRRACSTSCSRRRSAADRDRATVADATRFGTARHLRRLEARGHGDAPATRTGDAAPPNPVPIPSRTRRPGEEVRRGWAARRAPRSTTWLTRSSGRTARQGLCVGRGGARHDGESGWRSTSSPRPPPEGGDYRSHQDEQYCATPSRPRTRREAAESGATRVPGEDAIVAPRARRTSPPRRLVAERPRDLIPITSRPKRLARDGRSAGRRPLPADGDRGISPRGANPRLRRLADGALGQNTLLDPGELRTPQAR